MEYSLKNQEINQLLNIPTFMDDTEGDNSGEEVQKLSAIRQLPQLLQSDENGYINRVLPKVLQALHSASTEFHMESAKAFAIILRNKIIHHQTFTATFMPTVVYYIDSRDPAVANAWLDTLLDVVESLPNEVLKRDILPLALAKGQISQNSLHRVAACKLLGKLSSRFDQNTVKKDILPMVHSLCQDVNEAVRACICAQLHLVAKGLPSDLMKPALVPILIELGRDEMVVVRMEATQTIAHMIPHLSKDVLKVSIVPLVTKICEQAVVTLDDTLVVVARQFGSFCLGLEGALEPLERMWMVTYYHNMSHFGLPSHTQKKEVGFMGVNMDRLNARYIECRQLCAYNFPAMTKFCASNNDLLEKLYPSFCDFSTDPYFMVRRTVGAGLHEVARLLGHKNKAVKNVVLTLLWDNMEEVLQGVVPHLARTLELLVSSGVMGQEQDPSNVELGRALLQCDKTLMNRSHNWRLYAEYIAQLEVVVKCLSSDYIYMHFITIIFHKMHRSRALPCRFAAVKTLLVLLRYNLKASQRQEIRARLQAEFCYSTSCYKRMLFLHLCVTAREVFSRAYFKEHFYYLLLSKADDKVANNRLLLVRQLPALKSMLSLPGDKKYLLAVESCLRGMMAVENDRDVGAELRAVAAKMDKMGQVSAMPSLDDVEDKRKLDEEMKLAAMAPKPGWGIALVEKKAAVHPARTQGALSQPHPSQAFVASKGSAPTSTTRLPSNAGSSSSSSSHGQSITNKSNNLYSMRTAIVQPKANDQNCTCYSPLRSDYHQNLNVKALVDTNLEKSKILDNIKQKLNSDTRFKPNKSSKFSMEISWLNLETDLKNELFSLVNNSKIHGDRNFKEKSKFLSDFRDFNDSSLSRFISDNREYKDTIYNVRGVSSYYTKYSANHFEEKLHFFEARAKLDDANTNNDFTDCSCFDLTERPLPTYFKPNDSKKHSHFSKSFEDDFYRDAGIKANEIIQRKFSGIPLFDKPQVSAPKMSSSVTNKRRTWFGNETVNGTKKSLDLDTVPKYTSWESKGYVHKKAETLPMRESISLEKIGIGPRSKSFILPSTLIYSDKQLAEYQSTKLIFDKKACLKLSEQVEKVLQEKLVQDGPGMGAIPKARTDGDTNRFGFRPTAREKSPKMDVKPEKSYPKTKIPVGRMSNSSSPGSSRSSSPNSTKENEKMLRPVTKKPNVVASRKSLLIQTNVAKNDVKNNRRSLDATKISISNLDKNNLLKRRGGDRGKGLDGGLSNVGSCGEDKAASTAEVSANGNSSRLPVRRSKSEK